MATLQEDFTCKHFQYLFFESFQLSAVGRVFVLLNDNAFN